MRVKWVLPLFIVLITTSAIAEDVMYLKFSELFSSKDFKETLDKGVALHWLGEKRPAFHEYSLPESYTGTSKSFSGSSRKHCAEALEEALGAFVDEADSKGYDAIVDLTLVVNGNTSSSIDGFSCKLGERITSISLTGRLALSDVSANLLAAMERKALSRALRQPSEGAIFLPLEPVLSSPEARAILGGRLSADWHFPAPAYVFRKGPSEYEGEANITPTGKEAACNQAVLNALSTMVEEAKLGNYDHIIKIRSYLEKQFVSDAAQFECAISRKTVSVNLQASLATKN